MQPLQGNWDEEARRRRQKQARRRRRGSMWSDIFTLGVGGIFILLWLAGVILTLVLMFAAARYLLHHG